MADNERSQTGGEEGLRTAANAVTLTRLVVATLLFTASAYLREPTLNLAGLAVYWLGDVSDGFLVRDQSPSTGQLCGLLERMGLLNLARRQRRSA